MKAKILTIVCCSLTMFLMSCGGDSSTSTPKAPGKITLTSPVDDAIDQTITVGLTWVASAEAISYKCQLSKDSTFATILYEKDNITTNAASPNGLVGNTVYYWRVNATNAFGTSEWSATWSFTTKLIQGTFYSLYDMHISKNFGIAMDDTLFKVKNSATEAQLRKGFVLFDVSSGSVTNVTKATLRLKSANTPAIPSTIEIFELSDTTWKDIPGVKADSLPFPGPTFGNPLDSDTITVFGEWHEWDVTTWVKAQITAGAKKIAFGVWDAAITESQPFFYSRESANDPELIITQ